MNKRHREILNCIKENAGKPTQHTFSDSYLGNRHYRYPINAPKLRNIARTWMASHRHLKPNEMAAVLTSLIEGESSTEKCMAGIILDYITIEQRKFDPALYDNWLDHLVGWAEVDSVCTGKYTETEIVEKWAVWKKWLVKFSKSQNPNKRRAALVLLCSPLRRSRNDRLARFGLQLADRLKHEKPVLITKAISWLLRSMEKHHRELVRDYVFTNRESLPAIAVRETMTKLRTGKKTEK